MGIASFNMIESFQWGDQVTFTVYAYVRCFDGTYRIQ